MRIWIASADIAEIEQHEWAPIAGIITNPTVLLKAGSDWRSTLQAIATYTPRDGEFSPRVHVQAVSRDRDSIIREMSVYAALLVPKTLICKVPMGPGGIAATKHLVRLGFEVNITGISTIGQLQLAAEAGASFVSVYVARLNDARGGDAGYRVVEDARRYLERYDPTIRIMAASVRDVDQYHEVIRLGAHAVAAPPQLIDRVVFDPETERSMEAFAREWRVANS
jgi:transaldolase